MFWFIYVFMKWVSNSDSLLLVDRCETQISTIFIQILCRLFQSYVHHVAATKVVASSVVTVLIDGL